MAPLPVSWPALSAAVQRGVSFKFLGFWKPSQPLGCLGQWWPSTFSVDGQRYTTAEQYMMAGKAAMMGDPQTRARILAAHDPREVKALGRQVQPWDEARWKSGRVPLVVAGNLAKFSQDLDLQRQLLDTGDHVLVEASPLDRLWGVGLAVSNPAHADPLRWRGQNLLGFALMVVRARLGGAPVDELG